MLIRSYIRHISLMIFATILSSFLVFVFFWNLNILQYIISIPIFLLFFRIAYQTITVGILSTAIFFFSEKKLKIMYAGFSPSKYMIVETIKNKPSYKPYFYMNRGIDWFLNKIIKLSGGNRIINYEVHDYSFTVIIKDNLSKEDAEYTLIQLNRLKKLKRILDES